MTPAAHGSTARDRPDLRDVIGTIPSLATALDPRAMGDRLGTEIADVDLVAVKPGRRAVVRYGTIDGALIGKVRVGHRPASPYRLMQRFRAAGFDRGAVRVAEPIAVIDDLDLWVQRAAPGQPGDELLDQPSIAVEIARLAADAVHRIHVAGVPTKRVHTIDDELTVLESRLTGAAVVRPDLAPRLRRLLVSCRRRAAGADDLARRGGPTGIHRDAYADQLLVDLTGGRFQADVDRDGTCEGAVTTVIDFDLYCLGDPALDVGNFVAHLTEHALRTAGDPTAHLAAERACRDTFLGLAGGRHAQAVDVHADLTLARHVALSTTVPGRSHLTDAVLDLCEARLG